MSLDGVESFKDELDLLRPCLHNDASRGPLRLPIRRWTPEASLRGHGSFVHVVLFTYVQIYTSVVKTTHLL